MHNDARSMSVNHIKAAKYHANGKRCIASKTNDDKNTKGVRKLHLTKHITVKLSMPEIQSYPTYALASILHTSKIRNEYHYLYSKEINPPPPKFC
jgi:hypothetical protein